MNKPISEMTIDELKLAREAMKRILEIVKDDYIEGLLAKVEAEITMYENTVVV